MKESNWNVNCRAAALFVGLTVTTLIASGRPAIWQIFMPPADAVAIASLSQIISAVNTRSALIIDLRSPDQFRAGHILHAVNIPLNRLKAELPDLTNSPNIILYGQGRSFDFHGVQIVLEAAGLADRAGVFEEGWDEWAELGLPSVADGMSVSAYVEQSKTKMPRPLGNEARQRRISVETSLLESLWSSGNPAGGALKRPTVDAQARGNLDGRAGRGQTNRQGNDPVYLERAQ